MLEDHIGATFDVVLQGTRKGSIRANLKIEKLPLYLLQPTYKSMIGDIWRIQISHLNASKTAFHFSPLQLLTAHDGRTKMLREYPYQFHEHIREASNILLDLRSKGLHHTDLYTQELCRLADWDKLHVKFRLNIANQAVSRFAAKVDLSHLPFIQKTIWLAVQSHDLSQLPALVGIWRRIEKEAFGATTEPSEAWRQAKALYLC